MMCNFDFNKEKMGKNEKKKKTKLCDFKKIVLSDKKNLKYVEFKRKTILTIRGHTPLYLYSKKLFKKVNLIDII